MTAVLGEVTAVDVEDVTGDESGFVRPYEHDTVGDFSGEAEAAQRNLRHQRGSAIQVNWVSVSLCQYAPVRLREMPFEEET